MFHMTFLLPSHSGLNWNLVFYLAVISCSGKFIFYIPNLTARKVKLEYSWSWVLEISWLGRKKLSESLLLSSEIPTVLCRHHFMLSAWLLSTDDESIWLWRLILTNITLTTTFFFLKSFEDVIRVLNVNESKLYVSVFFLYLQMFWKSNTFNTDNHVLFFFYNYVHTLHNVAWMLYSVLYSS